MICRVGLLGILLQALPSHGASTLEFFEDRNCRTSMGSVNGTTDGVCQQSIANNLSIRVVSLDQTCAATIYSDPFCSNDATIANLNTCMSGSLVVGSFSIDCRSVDPSESPIFSQEGNVPTSSRSIGPVNPTTSPTAVEDLPLQSGAAHSGSSSGSRTHGVSPGVIAGIVIGCIFIVALLPLTWFVRRYLKKKTEITLAHANFQGGPGPSELHGVEKVEIATGDIREPPPPVHTKIIGVLPGSNDTRSNRHQLRAKADSDAYTLRSPPAYHSQGKSLPHVSVQKPGHFAELDSIVPSK